jgi:hypothetical protein
VVRGSSMRKTGIKRVSVGSGQQNKVGGCSRLIRSGNKGQ